MHERCALLTSGEFGAYMHVAMVSDGAHVWELDSRKEL